MRKTQKPKVNNIRLTIFLRRKGIKPFMRRISGKILKKCNNFFIYREKYTFTIFPNCGKIGVTKIRNFQEARKIIRYFCKLFNISTKLVKSKYRVDNISANGTFNRQLDLLSLQTALNNLQSSKLTVQFDNNKRPEAICRSYSIGNIAVFASGKYFIVGAKCVKNLKVLVQEVCNVLPQLPPMKQSVRIKEK